MNSIIKAAVISTAIATLGPAVAFAQSSDYVPNMEWLRDVVGPPPVPMPVPRPDWRKCIRDNFEVYEDMAIAKRLCDPKNHVTNPNEYGWVCKTDNDATRVKGSGWKRKQDAIDACE